MPPEGRRISFRKNKPVTETAAPEPLAAGRSDGLSQAVGPDCFGGSDEGSHYMSSKQALGPPAAAAPTPPPPPAASREAPAAALAPTNMIKKQIPMPVGIWAEVLSLSKAGGMDHQDVLVELLDLGLQAQSVDAHRPRLVALPAAVMERVASASSAAGISDDEAFVRLVDLGLQAKAEKLGKAPRQVRPGTLTRIEWREQGKKATTVKVLGNLALSQVPGLDEVVTIGGDHYVVIQRAWGVSRAGATAVLRVEPYPG